MRKEDSIKLSECTKQGEVFLYDGETVGVMYVLNKIARGEQVDDKVELVIQDEMWDKNIDNMLRDTYEKYSSGQDVDEYYTLSGINTKNVIIDISKDQLKKDKNGNYTIKK